jgi:hypothetical protein
LFERRPSASFQVLVTIQVALGRLKTLSTSIRGMVVSPRWRLCSWIAMCSWIETNLLMPTDSYAILPPFRVSLRFEHGSTLEHGAGVGHNPLEHLLSGAGRLGTAASAVPT